MNIVASSSLHSFFPSWLKNIVYMKRCMPILVFGKSVIESRQNMLSVWRQWPMPRVTFWKLPGLWKEILKQIVTSLQGPAVPGKDKKCEPTPIIFANSAAATGATIRPPGSTFIEFNIFFDDFDINLWFSWFCQQIYETNIKNTCFSNFGVRRRVGRAGAGRGPGRRQWWRRRAGGGGSMEVLRGVQGSAHGSAWKSPGPRARKCMEVVLLKINGF